MKSSFDQIHSDNEINNPSNYKWGVFYFNKKDKRVVLPKYQRERGWTVNFANPLSYLFILLIIVIIVSFSIFL
jgi:uncharacterized membrane protein